MEIQIFSKQILEDDIGETISLKSQEKLKLFSFNSNSKIFAKLKIVNFEWTPLLLIYYPNNDNIEEINLVDKQNNESLLKNIFDFYFFILL